MVLEGGLCRVSTPKRSRHCCRGGKPCNLIAEGVIEGVNEIIIGFRAWPGVSIPGGCVSGGLGGGGVGGGRGERREAAVSGWKDKQHTHLYHTPPPPPPPPPLWESR